MVRAGGDADGGFGDLAIGLLSAAGYLKDNWLLPSGFDKKTAPTDVAVIGGTLDDADFAAAGDRVRYLVPVTEGVGPFQIEVELLYQPIGFRWAHNLRSYDAAEPKRFLGYFKAMSESPTATLARASR